MAQEETRQKQMEKVEVVPKPAYYVSNMQERHVISTIVAYKGI
jgi:hypothetical protein